MKLVVDESGNTGCCVLNKNNFLNFKEQPTFALCVIVINSYEDEQLLTNKYLKFKKKFNIDGEIKGSELVTKKRNEELKYFKDKILDDKHFYLHIYDKRFYLSTLLLYGLLGNQFKDELTLEYYILASQLSIQDDDFFVEYLKYIENPSPQSFHMYLKYLINFQYQGICSENNYVIMVAKKMLDNQDEEVFYDEFLSYGSYDNKNQTNVINLTALGEIIYLIKRKNAVSNSQIEFYHDSIEQLDSTIFSELERYNINIQFFDSKQTILGQVADNAVSVFRHAYDKMLLNYKNNEAFEQKNEWDMCLMAEITDKITMNNIKATVPLQDWALIRCTQYMFSNNYPQCQKNKFTFSSIYMNALLVNAMELIEHKESITNVENRMRD